MTEQKEKPLLLAATDEAIARVEERAINWWNNLRGDENPAAGFKATQISIVKEFLLNSEGVTMYHHKHWKRTK